MNLKPINIGVIGAGNITRNRHLPGLQKIPGVRLLAVCNRSLESSQKVADAFHFERVERSASALIHAEDIDAVLIGTWPYKHHTLTVQALRAGKHVFTQARMARNLKEALLMRREAEKHPKLVSMICPSPFGMQFTLYVIKLIKEGYIGKIRLARFRSFNSVVASPNTPIHWRQQRALNGINTLAFGIFVERFLQWFGPINSVLAHGDIFTPFRKDASGRRVKVTVYDQLNVIATLKNHPGTLNLCFSGAVSHPPSEEMEIYGDKGTLNVNFDTGTLQGAGPGEKVLRELDVPPSLRREWTVERDFVDAIRSGGRRNLSKERTAFFPPDFVEGVRYMAVTEAAIHSARIGKAVKVQKT
jgi:predicted dehydrogenase